MGKRGSDRENGLMVRNVVVLVVHRGVVCGGLVCMVGVKL